VVSYISDMFLCSSSVHDLDARVLPEHDPLILWLRLMSSRIRLYD